MLKLLGKTKSQDGKVFTTFLESRFHFYGFSLNNEPGRWLLGELLFHPGHQEFEPVVGLGKTAHDELPAIGRRKRHIHHLNLGDLSHPLRQGLLVQGVSGQSSIAPNPFPPGSGPNIEEPSTVNLTIRRRSPQWTTL